MKRSRKQTTTTEFMDWAHGKEWWLMSDESKREALLKTIDILPKEKTMHLNPDTIEYFEDEGYAYIVDTNTGEVISKRKIKRSKTYDYLRSVDLNSIVDPEVLLESVHGRTANASIKAMTGPEILEFYKELDLTLTRREEKVLYSIMALLTVYNRYVGPRKVLAEHSGVGENNLSWIISGLTQKGLIRVTAKSNALKTINIEIYPMLAFKGSESVKIELVKRWIDGRIGTKDDTKVPQVEAMAA